jgi:hypothetical protein
MKVYCAFAGTILLKASISPIPRQAVNDNLTYMDFEIGSIENHYPDELAEYIGGLAMETRHKLLTKLEKTDYALYLVVLLKIPGLLDHALRLILEKFDTCNRLIPYVEAIEKENNNVNS